MKIMRYKLYNCMLLLALFLVQGCSKNPFNKDSVRTVETLNYEAMPEEEVINFNSRDGSTVVMMGKYLPNDPNYKFMYLVKSGVWFGTNMSINLGDTLQLDQLNLKIIPTLDKNGNNNLPKN